MTSADTAPRPPPLAEWARAYEEGERLAAHLPPLLIDPDILSAAATLGLHGRRKTGPGESFWQFRHYRSGDTAQSIDWRQSARSDALYIREREWEAAEDVWFWRDRSPGMDFTSSSTLPTKATRADILALALASALARGGERIGLWGDARPPASGRAAPRLLAEKLAHDPTRYSAPPEQSRPVRGTLIWLSDFLDPIPEIEIRLARLAHLGMQGFLVQINDPVEEDFPYRGRVRFHGNGSVHDPVLVGRAEMIRDSYRARLAAQAEGVGAAARRLGWSLTRHRTDHSPLIPLTALYGALVGARRARTR